MKYKDGVIVSLTKIVANEAVNLSASAEIQNAIVVADRASRKVSGKEMIITSLLDSVHSKNSRHYSGNAFDMRIWIYTERQIMLLMLELKSALGNGYDVINEGDHIHIEWDK